jgi:hypothetical protein
MKIRDLTNDTVNEGPLGAIGRAVGAVPGALYRGARGADKIARTITKGAGASFGKGMGGGVGVTEPDTTWASKALNPKGSDKDSSDDSNAKPQTGTYQKKSGIDPRLEKELVALTPEQQQAILNIIKQGKV